MRAPAARDGGDSTIVTDSAWGPRRPSATPNSSFVPGLTVVTPDGREVAGRNTSSPSSEEMKPKPFSRLNHLTRPVGIAHSPLLVSDFLSRALNLILFMMACKAEPYFIVSRAILAP